MTPSLNRRLTSMDASFLYFEKPEAPMHIGSVSVFEGEIPFEDFVRNVESKIHLLPRYQQLITPDPFNIGHPTWEFDSQFDIRNHIFNLRLDAPGSEEELSNLSSQLMASMMDRGKPLWDVYIVHGLEGGNSAMIARVHHCMVDGVSGVDLLKIVLDISPKPAPAPAPPKEQRHYQRPDPMRGFLDTLLETAKEGMNRWMEFQTGLLNLAETLTKDETRGSWMNLRNSLPALATPVSLLPFNKPCKGEKKHVWNTFSFAEARAIRGEVGGTVNDVVLTVLSGAVSRYAELHNQQIAGRNLRVMVPVSLRREDQHGALGNLVSLMPVEIPLDIKDPIARMRFISQKTSEMKNARIAEGINLFTALMSTLPAPVQSLVGTIASTPIPPFNMVCTNVPGPQIPLYAAGRRMLHYYPYVPVGYAIGVGCAIMSYDQRLYFGLTSDLHAMPDVENLREFLYQSFAELREAAGVPEIQPQVLKTGATHSEKPSPTKVKSAQASSTAKARTSRASASSGRKRAAAKTSPAPKDPGKKPVASKATSGKRVAAKPKTPRNRAAAVGKQDSASAPSKGKAATAKSVTAKKP